jgi:hypothetical protein
MGLKDFIALLVVGVLLILALAFANAEQENCVANGGTVVKTYGRNGGFSCIYENN